MLRGFFVGAMVGFFWGSSKQGMQMRKRLDNLLTDLLSDSNEEAEEKPVEEKPGREPIRGKFGKQSGGNGARGGENGDRRRGKSDSDEKEPQGELPMDKAVELAEALNAKPTPPPTDELEPGEHAVGL